MNDQARNTSDCEHHWVSSHEPDHLLYWVQQCSLCHQVNWTALDCDILDLFNDVATALREKWGALRF